MEEDGGGCGGSSSEEIDDANGRLVVELNPFVSTEELPAEGNPAEESAARAPQLPVLTCGRERATLSK